MPNSDSQQNTEGWGDIDWRKVERYVFKLQTRIYAASRHGEVKKVRKLQRTLMRSWSNKVLKVHQEKIKSVILKHRSSPQAALIKDLNPIIKGWTNYYSNSDIKTVGVSSRQDYLTYLTGRVSRPVNFDAGQNAAVKIESVLDIKSTGIRTVAQAGYSQPGREQIPSGYIFIGMLLAVAQTM